MQAGNVKRKQVRGGGGMGWGEIRKIFFNLCLEDLFSNNHCLLVHKFNIRPSCSNLKVFQSSSSNREWPILSSGQEEKYDEGESCNKEASSTKCECEESHFLTWQKMTFVNLFSLPF